MLLAACTREPTFLRTKETGLGPNPDQGTPADTQGGESGRRDSGRRDSGWRDSGPWGETAETGTSLPGSDTARTHPADTASGDTAGGDTGEAEPTAGDTAPSTDPSPTTDTGPLDSDEDGFPARLDCDDGDPSAYPGAPEVCEDGRDQDCDGADRPCPRLTLTPTTGRLNLDEGIYWADRGYTFQADRDFAIRGASWWVDIPTDGQVRASVYTWPEGDLLARGTPSPGLGVEAWLRSDLEFEFEAGREYLVAFYTDRAASGTFRYLAFPTWGYSVDGTVSRLVGWSSVGLGDDAPEATSGAGGTFGNSWAPFQELHLR